MKLHKNFVGGNIDVVSVSETEVHLKNEPRDTAGGWFYWAFCVEGAEGKTLSFCFDEPDRVGYYGAAVSRDLRTWQWTNSACGEGFSYTFGPEDSRVYFAHHMLYHPARFADFCASCGLQIEPFCRSRKGREVPSVRFGQGEQWMVLTARHHACESTGNYVLEGVLSELLQRPIPGFSVLCVPFVDFDGVLDGDQGKNRAPYDHNRDYNRKVPAIYPETAALRAFVDAHHPAFAFDFHSPWHIGGENDKVFLPQQSFLKKADLDRFGELFESVLTPGAMQYRHAADVGPNAGWNRVPAPYFVSYAMDADPAALALGLETCFFGKDGTKFSESAALETGECFAEALRRWVGE